MNFLTPLRSTRPPFLLLALACVFLGVATSLASSAQIDLVNLLLVFIGALAAHASINLFNEYFDFRSGLDTRTKKTPFSGGSGALIDAPASAGGVLTLAIITLLITVFIGLYFIADVGMLILPIGLLGIVIILSYTPWLNRRPLLCLIAPGLGFGPLMVGGTHVVLSGGYSWVAFYVSLVPFFLANNLLLLNQFPDVEADKSAGRKHVPIVYGLQKSTAVYGMFVAAACIVIIAGSMIGILPGTTYYSLVPMGAAVAAYFGARRHADSLQDLLPSMGLNVIATVVTPVVLGVVIIFG